MQEIQTIHGETFLVDDEDYEKSKQYRWTVSIHKGRGQVVTTATYNGKHYHTITYKRLILGIEGKHTFYKNDNWLDLRKENILVFNTRSEGASAINTVYRNKTAEFNTKLSKASQGRNGRFNGKT